jgi:uncharacterized protein (DUF2062 family)
MQKLKDYLKKFSPDHKSILSNKYISIFGSIVHDPRLWHFNRRPVIRAFGVGVLCAWIPIPCHTLIAIVMAIRWHCNLPLSMALVWVSNPITMPAQFYIAYEVGAHLMREPHRDFDVQFNMDSLLVVIHEIWQPFLLGSIICAIISGLLSYFIMSLVWRYFVITHWLARKKYRALKKHLHHHDK